MLKKTTFEVNGGKKKEKLVDKTEFGKFDGIQIRNKG